MEDILLCNGLEDRLKSLEKRRIFQQVAVGFNVLFARKSGDQ